MHDLFHEVLNKKDLSKAGDLFQVPDSLILSDLTTTIGKIIEISSLPDYSHNVNDQSVVEICITRLTSAIRENPSVELEGLALVSLLQTCLNHNLRPTTPDTAPPHAKIAGDIIACIFLHYQQRAVMTAALPVAVKLLHKGNADLSRSISSYLSLAAIHSAPLLSQHIHTIVDSVIAGNYSLARILPGLYNEAEEPLQRHIMTLVSILPRCVTPSDSQPLLQLFALVAANKPALLENSIPQLVDCLFHLPNATPIFQVLVLLSRWRPTLLLPHLTKMMSVIDVQQEVISVALQTVCAIGKSSSDTARTALRFVAGHLHAVEKSSLAEVLREIGTVVSLFPKAVGEELLGAMKACENATTRNTLATVNRNKDGSSSGRCEFSGGVHNTNRASREQLSKGFKCDPIKEHQSMYQQAPSVSRPHKYQKNVIGSNASANGTEPWRTSAKLIVSSSNRSMPKLSGSGVGSSSSSRLGSSSIKLNKSLTRLNSSHHALSTITRSINTLTPVSSSRPVSSHTDSSRHFSSHIDSSRPLSSHTDSSRPLSSHIDSSRPLSSHMDSSRPLSSHMDSSIGVPPVTPTQQSFKQSVHPNKRYSTPFPVVGSKASTPVRYSMGYGAMPSMPASLSSSSPPSGIIKGVHSSDVPLAATSSEFNYQSRAVTSQGSQVSASKNSSVATLGMSSENVCSVASSHDINILEYNNVNTTVTTITTTANSSGAVTSASSGSVCGSAGSLSNNNNNNSAHQLNDVKKHRVNKFHPLEENEAEEDAYSSSPIVMRNKTSPASEDGVKLNTQTQRASIFEPFAMKDTVQHFCEKHRQKIKAYMQKVFVKLPLPVKCCIEERKRRKYAKLFFGCQGKGEHCLYNTQLFCIKVRYPRVWIHLMFLALQARSSTALSSRETQVSSLRHCWDTINSDETITFLTLVTTAFPSAKDMDILMQELRTNRFFDVFEYNGLEQQWGCFLCNHPDKALGFAQEHTPVIEGQLKEKKSKWKLFRKWRTRYFTLSGAHLSYRGDREDKGDIDVQRIRSVKVSKNGRQIPKAFEIFTDNKSFVLKAKDSSNAEEWVRCLSIVVAQQSVKEKSNSSGGLHTTNSMPMHLKRTSANYGVHSSSGAVWPSSRVSSNTSLPRSLHFSPHIPPSSSSSIFAVPSSGFHMVRGNV